MYFDLSIVIRRLPSDVFAFLRDKDQFPRKESSPVLILEKITPEPTRVGTRYREVVQMLPFVRGEIFSEITRYEPGKYLEEDFEGASMKGHLAYQLLPEADGTRLVQRENVSVQGFLRPLEPIIKLALLRRLRNRLDGIKAVLEGDRTTVD